MWIQCSYIKTLNKNLIIEYIDLNRVNYDNKFCFFISLPSTIINIYLIFIAKLTELFSNCQTSAAIIVQGKVISLSDCIICNYWDYAARRCCHCAEKIMATSTKDRH